jgi:hypothetical protein
LQPFRTPIKNVHSYDLQQIHATIIGLERDASCPSKYLNRNFKDFRRVEVEMDFGGLIEYLRLAFGSPMQIQIGGFEDREYSFSSRGQRPYERAFSIQGGNVLGVGWPIRNRSKSILAALPVIANSCPTEYPESLLSVRKAAERYGVLHAYHRQPDDVDNDFYFRLGTVRDPGAVDPAMQARVQSTVRQMLSLRTPLILDIDVSNVSLGFYQSAELPRHSTRSYPLNSEFLDEEFVQRGYGASTAT